jgi:hypothetical protein
MAFISEDKLFRAEVHIDKSLEVFTVSLISLESRACDIQDDAVSVDQGEKRTRSDTLIS